jgi:ketosteroid isomerase-like protein
MSQMSPEARALVDTAFDAINSGDIDAFLAACAEDVEFTSLIAEAEGAVFRGHEGVRAWWETVRGAFEGVRWELLDVREPVDGYVVNHFRMSGVLSGVPLEQTMWQAVRRADDGKIAWWGVFRTEREALAALDALRR